MTRRLLRPTHVLGLMLLFAPVAMAVAIQEGESGTGSQVVPVPHPDLAQLKPEVRATLEPAIRYFERRQREALDPKERGILYGRLGLHYQAHELQEAAAACYLNAMSLDLENFRWPYLLAVHYEETGDLAGAAQHYLESLALEPGNLPASIRLARVSTRAGRLDEAQALLERVLTVDPDNASALAALGDIAVERSMDALAVKHYERALALQPEATQLHYRLGLAYRALGDVEQAKVHLQLRGPRVPSIDDPILAFMQGHALGSGYFVRKGEDAMKDGNIEVAARFFDAAAAINPEDANALLGLGQALGALGRYQEAIERFAQTLALDHDNAAAHYFKAALHEVQGEDEAALQHYQAAYTADAANYEAGFMLANTLLRLQRFDEAAVQYGRLAKEREGNLELLYQEGLAWLANNRCAPAQTALLSAFQRNPRDNRVIQAIARMFAVCDSTEEQRAQALEYARRLYDTYPGLETSVTLAMVLAANGLYEDAVDFQTQAIFEALKENPGGLAPSLNANLERYRAGKPATRAWPRDHLIYRPARLTLDRL